MNSIDKHKKQREANADTILQAIEACFFYIDNIKLKVFHMSKFQQESESFSENSFYELMDMLDIFIQLVSDIYRILKKHHLSGGFCVKTVQGLEIHLLCVLKAILAAKHKKDFVMLMDLLEHELVENIIQWKIRVVPEFKKLKNFMRAL